MPVPAPEASMVVKAEAPLCAAALIETRLNDITAMSPAKGNARRHESCRPLNMILTLSAGPLAGVLKTSGLFIARQESEFQPEQTFALREG
jgi:hypothetical protein